MKNTLLRFLIIIITLLLLRCGGGKEIVQIHLKCDENTNGGYAVVVTVYQLINADKFRLSSFESLTQNSEAELGNDLVINSKFERTMVPGENFELKEFEIKNEANFLGVVADFHSPAADGWQQLISLNNDFDRLIISVHENSLSFQIDD
jgi:type VI secretion system VasD/TssJ family lipoprotein